jgi:hypothetical protein
VPTLVRVTYTCTSSERSPSLIYPFSRDSFGTIIVQLNRGTRRAEKTGKAVQILLQSTMYAVRHTYIYVYRAAILDFYFGNLINGIIEKFDLENIKSPQ